MTSVDGGISSAVTLTVTNDARFANLYAYIQYDPIGGNQDFIAHFTDLAPDIIEHVLDIPDCPAVRPGTSSAAVAGNYVYGYTKPGMYSGDFILLILPHGRSHSLPARKQATTLFMTWLMITSGSECLQWQLITAATFGLSKLIAATVLLLPLLK